MANIGIRSARGFRFTLAFSLTAFALLACGKAGTGKSGAYQAPVEPFPFLGKSATFAILAQQSINNIGATVIYGDVGLSQGSVMTGFATVRSTGGSLHPADALALRAQADSQNAYNNIRQKTCDHQLTGQDLGGMTLKPGTYCFDGDANLNGLLTLDFQGNKNANFLFQLGNNLRTGTDAGMRIIGDGESCNVFWLVPGTARLSALTNFSGAIFSFGDINMGVNAKLNGKLMSRTGSVSLNANEIYNNTCPWPGAN